MMGDSIELYKLLVDANTKLDFIIQKILESSDKNKKPAIGSKKEKKEVPDFDLENLDAMNPNSSRDDREQEQEEDDDLEFTPDPSIKQIPARGQRVQQIDKNLRGRKPEYD
jgi:hypothetical protein